MNRASWLLIIALCAADLGKEIAAGDGWRSLGLALVLLCLAGLRRDWTNKRTWRS